MTLMTGALASPLQLKYIGLVLHVQQNYIFIILFGQRSCLSCRIDVVVVWTWPSAAEVHYLLLFWELYWKDFLRFGSLIDLISLKISWAGKFCSRIWEFVKLLDIFLLSFFYFIFSIKDWTLKHKVPFFCILTGYQNLLENWDG